MFTVLSNKTRANLPQKLKKQLFTDLNLFCPDHYVIIFTKTFCGKQDVYVRPIGGVPCLWHFDSSSNKPSLNKLYSN